MAPCALRHSHRKTSFGTLHRHTECYTGTAQHPCKTKHTAKVLTIVQAQKAKLETYSKRSAAEAFKANLPQTAPFKIPSQTCLSIGFIYFHRTVQNSVDSVDNRKVKSKPFTYGSKYLQDLSSWEMLFSRPWSTCLSHHFLGMVAAARSPRPLVFHIVENLIIQIPHLEGFPMLRFAKRLCQAFCLSFP
jgi:hypothetical protein